MPTTATLEEIKAYHDLLEKDKITSDSLPSCPICKLKSIYFKLHSCRERRFPVICAMALKSVDSALVRFQCPGRKKTFTYYPDFAIPHKHYTRQSVTGFSWKYVKSDDITYERAVMVDHIWMFNFCQPCKKLRLHLT